MNPLDDRAQKASSTKDDCNAIRMNKELSNEEASPLLTLPLLTLAVSFALPIQLFHIEREKERVREREREIFREEVRAAGFQSGFFWALGLTRSEHNQIIYQ